MYLNITRLAISDTTYHGVFNTPEAWSAKANLSGNLGKPQPEDQTAAIHSNFIPVASPRGCAHSHCKGTQQSGTGSQHMTQHLQHPVLCGPRAWHLPKGLDFFMPSLCNQALNIKQQSSCLFPQGLISLFKWSSSTKCKELSAAQLIQSSPKSQEPCSVQIFVCY